jgi:hypothetical protein
MKTIIAALILTASLSSCAVVPTPDGGAVVVPLPPYPAYQYGGWYDPVYDRSHPWRPHYYRPYYHY